MKENTMMVLTEINILMDIRNHIEDSTADKIILQSAYSWYPNMSFSNAIEQIMKADTLLYNAANSSIIHWLACNRGFLSASCENKTINPLDKSKLDYFITPQGLLCLNHPLFNASIQLFTLEGKLVFSTILNGNQLQHYKSTENVQGHKFNFESSVFLNLIIN